MKAISEVVIIGGGPAGISCALDLQLCRVDHVLLERESRFGGQLLRVPNPIRNFPGGFYSDGRNLAETMEDMVSQVRCRYQLEQEVTAVDLAGKTVICGGQTVVGRALVIATGLRVRELSLPGAELMKGEIAYEIESLPRHRGDSTTTVIGGGDSACLDALELSEICSEVCLIHRSARLSARPDIIREVMANSRIKVLLNTSVKQVVRVDGLDRLRVISGAGTVHDIAVERLLIKIGYLPNTELVSGQVEMTDDGYISINQDCATSLAGVYAIGDITHPGYPRIATAVGQGVLCSQSIQRYLWAGEQR